jgi:hypothetical protein
VTQEMPEQWQQLAERKGIRPTIRGIAEAAGVTASTVSRLIFQARTSPGTVHAISTALGISTSDVLRYAGVPSGELGPWDPPREAHMLTGKQRKALDDLIRAVASEEPRATITQLPGREAQLLAEIAHLRTQLRVAREDVEQWENVMPDSEGGWETLRAHRAKVRDLELQEDALSERLLAASSETSL